MVHKLRPATNVTSKILYGDGAARVPKYTHRALKARQQVIK